MNRLIVILTFTAISFAHHSTAMELENNKESNAHLLCHFVSTKSIQSLQESLLSAKELKKTGIILSILGVSENNYKKVDDLLTPFTEQISHLYIFQDRANAVVTVGKIAELPIVGFLSTLCFNYDLIGDTGIAAINRSPLVKNNLKGFKIELVQSTQLQIFLHEWSQLFSIGVKLGMFYRVAEA